MTRRVIVVTPTYRRAEQVQCLQRIGDMLSIAAKKVPLTWIVVEDAARTSAKVAEVIGGLQRMAINCHQIAFGPTNNWGNMQKNHALKYIIDRKLVGNVCIMDDDNYAHYKHFVRVSKVRSIGVWRVNGMSIRGTEGPVVNNSGDCVAFDGGFKARKFAIDMAGFAVSTDLFGKLTANFLNTDHGTNWESKFLEQFTEDRSHLEVFDNGKVCYVSHNEPFGGDCEISWSIDEQPRVYKIEYHLEGQGFSEVTSRKLGTFRTLALTEQSAISNLREAIAYRFFKNEYTNSHVGKLPSFDPDQLVIEAVSHGPNEKEESWTLSSITRL